MSGPGFPDAFLPGLISRQIRMVLKQHRGYRINGPAQIVKPGRHRDRHAVKRYLPPRRVLIAPAQAKLDKLCQSWYLGPRIQARVSRIGHDGLSRGPRELELLRREAIVAPSAWDINLVG